MLGPVVYGPRHRIVRRQFGETQPEEHLAAEGDEPGPPERRARNRERKEEQLERAGEDRDEREAGRERGERTERATEFLFVAESGQMLLVRARCTNGRRGLLLGHRNPLSPCIANTSRTRPCRRSHQSEHY